MEICYHCKKALVQENKSKEHIIPNSIGGRLKSDKLLCNKCNSGFGAEIDSALSKSYGDLVALLCLERERGKTYLIKNLKTRSGEQYHLVDGRVPTPVKPKINLTDQQISIVARDVSQLGQVLKGLSKKYPELAKIDLSKLKKSPDRYLSEPVSIKFTFGGDEVFRSIAKMALNLYLSRGGNQEETGEILEVISGIRENDNHIHNYLIPQALLGKDKEVLHLITIKGSAGEQTLTAFVMLFGLNGFIVNLSTNYTGSDFAAGYRYDVLSFQASTEFIPFGYPGKDAFSLDLKTNEEAFHLANINALKRNLTRLSRTIDAQHTEKGISEITKSALDNASNKNGNPETFTSAMKEDFMQEIAERAAIWLANLDNRRNKIDV
ncbi:MAG: HNH endonuclease [Sphingobacteriales bacterium]|nr:MAG: HNH endonuclease [Sphingobacteriales bacterium]